jgi:hypothetical protein
VPLNLTDITQKQSTAIVNRWAQGQETQTTQHGSDIATLKATLLDVFRKNPSLVKPNGMP